MRELRGGLKELKGNIHSKISIEDAEEDLRSHKLPTIFSYRAAYFAGAKKQLDISMNEIQQARQEVAQEIFESLFPPKIYPRHLEYWTEQISKEQGYDSQLTNFLARLATNWQSLKDKFLGDVQ